MSDRKKAYIILALGIVMMCVAVLGAWFKFDYRAATIVACGILIGISVGSCLHFLDVLQEEESCEIRIFKCQKCGEVIKYRLFADSKDELQEAGKLVSRCPICGGDLAEVTEDGEESGHA